MNEEKGLKKILKWAGIVALIGLPVFVILKNKKNHQSDAVPDDTNIFSSELED